MFDNRWSRVAVPALLIALAAGAGAAQEPGQQEAEPGAAAQQPAGQKPEAGEIPDLALPSFQQREPPVFREQIVVNEVLLDVLVTDKSGHVVTGLGIDDFVVLEDGHLIIPESVTFYGDPASLRASGPGRSDRYFIFLFHHDKSRSTFLQSAQNRMARDARKWLEKERFPNDQVAVLSFDLDLWLHQDFTRDPDKILAAVDNAARGKRTRTSRGDGGYRPDPATRQDRDSPSLFNNLPRYREFKRQTRTFQEALELVAKAATGVTGRKNMLLFSGGFGEIGGMADLHTETEIYKRLDQALNTANVALYTFDVIGIYGGDPRNASYGTMASLSYDTGGRYFERDTNFLDPLTQVGQQNLGYYLISYRSAYERGSSGYRQIEVGAPRGQFFVRARSGYRYGEDPSSRP